MLGKEEISRKCEKTLFEEKSLGWGNSVSFLLQGSAITF
jgi:hypothetical protein